MKNLRMQQEMTDRGRLEIRVNTRIQARPVSGARVTVSYTGDPQNVIEELITDGDGRTETLDLATPPLEYSLEPNVNQPYSEYTVKVEAEGYEPVEVTGSELLSGEQSVQQVDLKLAEGAAFADVTIPDHTLFGEYPAKIPESEIKPTRESGEIVLSRVVIPEYIIVHDGAPTDSTARDYYVRYRDYIKNVACSEIYATWPDAAIRANILAIMSFTLNRVYTEWYRNKGYDFTITSSTAYDHKWIYGRNIFDSISLVVDEIFADYLFTEEHFSKREISYICFHYKLNDTEYADDLGKSMPFDQFYAAMAAGASTKTSQVNADEFEAYFETFLQDGKDILHVCLSSGISGVLNSAMIAKADLEERYPERKILIVDSLGASSGYGLLMDRLADLRDEGKPLEEVYDFAMKNRLKVHHWFFSTDLTFYVRGGRISKASGAIGGLLGICPLLNMDNEGRLIPRFKIRTKKKVIKKIVDQMEENAEGGLSYSGKCYISQSACYEDARAVADLIEERFPNLNGKVEINNIGTTIGSHTGPGTVALFFWGNERVD